MTILPFQRFGWQDTEIIALNLAHRHPTVSRIGLEHDDLVEMIQKLPGFVGRGRPDDDRILDMILWRWIAVANPDDGDDGRFDAEI